MIVTPCCSLLQPDRHDALRQSAEKQNINLASTIRPKTCSLASTPISSTVWTARHNVVYYPIEITRRPAPTHSLLRRDQREGEAVELVQLAAAGKDEGPVGPPLQRQRPLLLLRGPGLQLACQLAGLPSARPRPAAALAPLGLMQPPTRHHLTSAETYNTTRVPRAGEARTCDLVSTGAEAGAGAAAPKGCGAGGNCW